MASSISKEQKKFLASGLFNESISEDKIDDFFIRTDVGLVPINATDKLIEAAGFLVSEAQNNLIDSDRNSSGTLSSSIKVLQPKVVNGVNVHVDIEAKDYYTFVDAGVKGTKGGTSSKGYSYKKKGPPVEIIKQWLISEQAKGVTDKYTGLEKRDDRRKKIKTQEEKLTSLAAFISSRIKIKGLKQTNFFSNAVKDTKEKVFKEIGKGFKIDVINTLPKKI